MKELGMDSEATYKEVGNQFPKLPLNEVICGDALEVMRNFPSRSIDLVVTSPPYDIRQGVGYKAINEDILFLKLYSEFLDSIFNEIYRIIKDNGQFCLNLKNRVINKTLVPPTWVLFLKSIKKFKLKSLIIWKYAGSFDSSFLRFHNDYEFIFHFTKSEEYFINKNKDLTSVWYIPHTMPKKERTGHPTQYPEKLVQKILKMLSKQNDVILDPFLGSGTTCVVAKKLRRRWIGIEMNPEYIDIAQKRLSELMFYKPLEKFGGEVKG